MSAAEVERVWETFVRNAEELSEGAEIPLIIRDLTPGRKKYRMRHVVAVVNRKSGAQSTGETLWVRTTVGNRLDHPWSMKIVRELPLELPGTPYRDVYTALKKTAKMGL